MSVSLSQVFIIIIHTYIHIYIHTYSHTHTFAHLHTHPNFAYKIL